MEKSELKVLARKAKNRLRNGFWTKEKEYRKNELSRASVEGRAPNLLPNNYNQFIKSMTKRKMSFEEEQFYMKVKEIVLSGEEVDNPLGRLIDYEYYNELDYDQRQRYIFCLAERYREIAATIKK